MWYKISDKRNEVVFFISCSVKQMEAFLEIKIKLTGRSLFSEEHETKPEGVVSCGCCRVDIPEKNVFIEIFMIVAKK